MQINKLYISLKYWPALPPLSLAGQACGPSMAPLAWPSSPRSFLVREKIIDFIPFGSRFDMHLPYLIVEICSQRAHKKERKERKDNSTILFHTRASK